MDDSAHVLGTLCIPEKARSCLKMQANGLLTPSQAPLTTNSFIIPGITLNPATVQNGQTYIALNGNTIIVNKPAGSPVATSVTTFINGVNVTLAITNPNSPNTTVNGE